MEARLLQVLLGHIVGEREVEVAEQEQLVEGLSIVGVELAVFNFHVEEPSGGLDEQVCPKALERFFDVVDHLDRRVVVFAIPGELVGVDVGHQQVSDASFVAHHHVAEPGAVDGPVGHLQKRLAADPIAGEIEVLSQARHVAVPRVRPARGVLQAVLARFAGVHPMGTAEGGRVVRGVREWTVAVGGRSIGVGVIDADVGVVAAKDVGHPHPAGISRGGFLAAAPCRRRRTRCRNG